jgi:hypothetical protein
MTACLHKRMRSTVVFLEPTGPDQHRVAVMTISCHECGAPFEFATDLVETNGLKISRDRRELRIEVTEASSWRVQ